MDYQVNYADLLYPYHRILRKDLIDSIERNISIFYLKQNEKDQIIKITDSESRMLNSLIKAIRKSETVD